MDFALDAWADPAIEPGLADHDWSVVVRPVRAQDAALIEAFFDRLSPQARQRRYHAAIKALSPQWLERMTHPDLRSELQLVAVTLDRGRETCVGEARYAASEESPADREFALAVADAWQGHGIGSRLLRRLARHAERCGIARLYGEVLRDNKPMIELARRHGYELRRHPADARLLRVVKTLNHPLQPRAAWRSTEWRPAVGQRDAALQARRAVAADVAAQRRGVAGFN